MCKKIPSSPTATKLGETKSLPTATGSDPYFP